MADEKLTNDEELLDGAEAQAEEVVASSDEVADQAVAAAETEAADAVDAYDEKVEAAVQHVAEEAEADAEAMSDAAIQADFAGDLIGDEEPAPAPEPAPVEEEPAKKRGRRSKQARSEKAKNDVAAPAAKKASGLAALGAPAWLAIAAACLVLGVVLGRFVLGGGGASGALAGKSTVTEAELDQPYATYTYKGKKASISVREIIEQNGTLEAAKDEEGNYTLPSAEYALNAARTAILNSEVESRGIEVSEDDAKAYAEKALGTSDYEAIGATYGMDADAVKDLIIENCRLNTLREEIVGGELPTMPEAPTAAEEGKEAEVTKAYAEYIINIAGDAWDAKKKAWKEADGAYATALADSTFSADGASYNDAQTAYYVAYQEYSQKQTEMGSSWTDYLNSLMSNASIEIHSLVS